MTQQKIEAILSPYRVLGLAEDGCMLCGKVLGYPFLNCLALGIE